MPEQQAVVTVLTYRTQTTLGHSAFACTLRRKVHLGLGQVAVLVWETGLVPAVQEARHPQGACLFPNIVSHGL